MNIVEVEIDQIKPYWRNPRKNIEAVKAVKQSIEKYGFNVPIVLDMDGVIIAGHTRYKALLEMGAQSAPCVYSDMGAKKAKEYRIADNKTGEIAQWDIDSLRLEVRELDIIDILPGFTDSEMASLVKDVTFVNPDLDYHDQPQVYNGPVVSAVRPISESSAAEQVKFDEKENELNARFTEHSQKVQDNYVSVTCPHCAGEFVIDKSEMGR